MIIALRLMRRAPNLKTHQKRTNAPESAFCSRVRLLVLGQHSELTPARLVCYCLKPYKTELLLIEIESGGKRQNHRIFHRKMRFRLFTQVNLRVVKEAFLLLRKCSSGTRTVFDELLASEL